MNYLERLIHYFILFIFAVLFWTKPNFSSEKNYEKIIQVGHTKLVKLCVARKALNLYNGRTVFWPSASTEWGKDEDQKF